MCLGGNKEAADPLLVLSKRELSTLEWQVGCIFIVQTSIGILLTSALDWPVSSNPGPL